MERTNNNISLRRWIDGALESIDITSSSTSTSTSTSTNGQHRTGAHDPRTLALSSNVFLLSALKVARSLAEQVRQSQQLEDVDRNNNTGRTSLPQPGLTDWADSVTVHLSSSSNHDSSIDGPGGYNSNEEDVYGQDYLQPLPFSHDDLASPEELRDMLRSVVGDPSVFEREFDENYEEKSSLNFLSVASANFAMSPNVNINGDKVNINNQGEEMQRIYSLGLVFYEIFSGGEKPEMGDDNGVSPHKEEEEDDDISPGLSLSLNGQAQARPMNMASSLNLNVDDNFGRKKGKHDAEDNFEERTKKKVSQAPVSDDMNLISTGMLKSKGVRLSICNLIANMIDCINGDLSSDESYNSISDVCDDLQRMFDKPQTYLDDLDMAKLSATGLQLHENELGREGEFGTLRGVYQRSIAGASELAIISGISGTGKSVLAHRLGKFVALGGEGIFLFGKFDQMQQATPFYAISAALNQYCSMLINEGETARSINVAAELNRVLGKDAIHLSGVIPSLSAVIGQQNSHHVDHGCVDAQKRLLHLICQFVEVISSTSGAPVTLFLDDLQWADLASIGVIHQLLLMSNSSNKNKQFFFFGCVREEEVDGSHPILAMLSSVRQFGIQATIINLSILDQDIINMIISDVLCLPPRLTRSLSNIVHHKTKGNPLFFSQLMIALSRDGLLRLSLSRRRWVWDEENIQSRELPDDVVKFMTSNIRRHPKEMQMALSLLACFGASAKLKIIEALETQLQVSLITRLENAVKEGLLDKLNESYSFGHDRVQEAAYSMMRPEERCLFHHKYGIALASSFLESSDDGMLFTATSQLNHGGPSAIENGEQAVLAANLNLTAGKKAMEMSDFSSAYSYFDNGITFLPRKHWSKHYTLSLELFDNAAKCALSIGNNVSLQYISQQVLTFAQSFEDKLEILFLSVSSLSRHQPHKAIETAISVLAHLGEQFSDSYTESDTQLLIDQTKVDVQVFCDQELIEYKTMDDPSKKWAMKFLAKLELLTQMKRPSWQPIVTLKMVQLSMNYGHSPMSPLCFTYYGMMLARLGSIREGYSYVKIGRKLMDRIGCNEVAGEVISIGTQVRCFVEPSQSANEFFLQGRAAAMSAGDMSNAILSNLMHAIGSYWTGTKLRIVEENFAVSRNLMEKQNNWNMLAHQTPLERSMLILIGTDETELPDQPNCGKSSDYSTMAFCFNTMYIRYMFREYEQMMTHAEKYFSLFTKQWSLLYAHTAHAFVSGLVAFWVFRKTRDRVWAERGCKAKVAMRKWAESSGHNFQHKVYLLEAEEAFCYNDVESAKSFYIKAISFAQKHRFIHEEALACELAGHFFLEVKMKDTAMEYFLRAHEKYHEWGAVAKSNALFELVQGVFVPSPG